MASVGGALGGAASGAAIGSRLFPGWGTAIGAGLGGLLGLFGGGGNSDKELSPELARLYALESDRATAQNPLVEAAYRLAFHRLPLAAQAGFAEPSLATAQRLVPPVGLSGDYSEPFVARQALRNAEVRMRMADPIIQAITQMASLRLPRQYQFPVSRSFGRPTPDDRFPTGPGTGPGGDEESPRERKRV